MFTLFFRGPNVVDYQTAQLQNIEFYRLFFHKMLELGLYFPPSPFESSFVSLAHSKVDLEKTIEKAEDVFQAIAKI